MRGILYIALSYGVYLFLIGLSIYGMKEDYESARLAYDSILIGLIFLTVSILSLLSLNKIYKYSKRVVSSVYKENVLDDTIDEYNERFRYPLKFFVARVYLNLVVGAFLIVLSIFLIFSNIEGILYLMLLKGFEIYKPLLLYLFLAFYGVVKLRFYYRLSKKV